jgi:hypothetical protein
MVAGRAVRCARCGSDWVPATVAPATSVDAAISPRIEGPAAAEVPSPAVAPPEVEPSPPLEPSQSTPPTDGADARRSVMTVGRSAMARLAAHPALPRSSTALRLAWAASIVLLLLFLAAAYAWRGQIVAAWPPSARAYAALGLHPQIEPRQ